MLEVATKMDSSCSASGVSVGVSLKHFSKRLNVWRAEQVVVEFPRHEVGDRVVVFIITKFWERVELIALSHGV